MRRAAVLAVAGACAALAGCGARDAPLPADASRVPIPIGTSPGHQPPAAWHRVRAGRPIGSLRCRPGREPRLAGVHVEIFVDRRGVLVPPGIGIGGPAPRSGAYVRGGRCRYPVSTREPTGVVELDTRARVSLGDLFAVWGQPLSRTRLAGFRAGPQARVRVFVGGRAWHGDPRTMPLAPHQVIVLELGDHVAPHRSYRFPPGL